MKEVYNKLAQLSLVNKKFGQIANDSLLLKQLAERYNEFHGYGPAYRLLGIKANANCWQILGLSVESTELQIHKAWKKLCLKWHPDKAAANGISQAIITKEIMTKVMQIINEARDKCLGA